MGKGILSGIRVVDFTWVVAGPQATRFLGDWGAEVIKVERRETGGSSRNAAAFGGVDRPGAPKNSFSFHNFNRNKLSLTLNLQKPEGMQLLHQLIAVSDIVIENFSSRVMDRWGLDYEGLKRIKPDIIYVSMAGLGHFGRDHAYVTMGPVVQALSGLTFLSGLPDHAPAGWGYSYMDHTGGYYGAMATLLALHYRNRTGQGQWIDLAQVEAGMALTGTAILDRTVNERPARRAGIPRGNHAWGPAAAPHSVYRCAGEDQWVAISVFSDGQWQALCGVMGDPAWAQEPRFATLLGRLEHQDELDQRIEEWTSTLDRYEVMDRLQAVGVPAGVAQRAADRVERDPQLRERGLFPWVETPEWGLKQYEGLPMHLSKTPGSLDRPGPLLGEQNDYVLQEVLGLSAEEVQRLSAEGVL